MNLAPEPKGITVVFMANPAKNTFYDAPEVAIRCFERWSGLQVCFHDIERMMTPFLPKERYAHQNQFCAELKQRGFEPACRRFELDQLRPHLQTHPEGCAKVCHAGILEWAVPVMHAGRISMVLIAGLRRPGQGLSAHLTDDRLSRAFKFWPAALPKPERVTEEQSELYLEGLRQLAARLQLWLEEHTRPVAREPGANEVKRKHQRKYLIERFISSKYQEPVTIEDLSRELHLSSSRATHLIKELYGRTFVQQVTQFRLRHAAGMLWQTDKSVTDVAMECGFGDLSNFHKAFRKHFHMTPLQYRKRGSCH